MKQRIAVWVFHKATDYWYRCFLKEASKAKRCDYWRRYIELRTLLEQHDCL